MDSENNQNNQKNWTAYYEARTIFFKEDKTDTCEASWKSGSCRF
jgi:hypothetical protein